MCDVCRLPGDEDPIPVVPVTEEMEDAMGNVVFQALLKRIGVKPPASEQVGQMISIPFSFTIQYVLSTKLC